MDDSFSELPASIAGLMEIEEEDWRTLSAAAGVTPLELAAALEDVADEDRPVLADALKSYQSEIVQAIGNELRDFDATNATDREFLRKLEHALVDEIWRLPVQRPQQLSRIVSDLARQSFDVV